MTDPTDETATATDPPRPDPVLAALQERRARLKADVAHAEVQLADLHAEQDRVTAVALEARAQLDDVDAALVRLETDAALTARHESQTGLVVGDVFCDRATLHAALVTGGHEGVVVRDDLESVYMGWPERYGFEARPLPVSTAFPVTVLAVW